MTRAFAVEFDPNAWNVPVVVKSFYHYNRFCWPRKKRNECDFTLQPPRDVKHACYYPTSSIFDAKVLCRLLNQVSNFQIYCQTHDAIDMHIAKHGLDGITNMLIKTEEEVKSLGSGEGYKYYDFNNPEHLYFHHDMPFHVYEIDTKDMQNFKPCFFRQEYKMHDENGHPLYVIAMLERKSDGTANDDLFNYNIKFIGSNSPLTKIVDRIPLCDDELLYEQTIDEYYTQHQDYYEDWKNRIYSKISEKGFNRHFKTYDIEVNPYQRDCEIVIGGKYCPQRKYVHSEGIYICYNDSCPWYPGKVQYDLVKHDGVAPYNLFRNAFGDDIAKSVKHGEFFIDDMMPDVRNPDFIRAFNKFCCEEDVRFYDTIHWFDEDGAIEKRKKSLPTHIQRIKDWAATPGYDIFGFRDHDGKSHMIQSPIVGDWSKEPEPPVEKQDLATHLAELKTQLLTNNMYRVRYPAIWLKSPGKKRIHYANVSSNGDTKDGEHYWMTDYEVSIKYTRPKSEPSWACYRLRCFLLAPDLEQAIDDMGVLQSDYNFKWAPSRLFTKNTDDEVFIDRCNVDYNGITILNPKKMNSITCDHYEIHTIDWSQGDDRKSTEIVLFDKNDAVVGTIHSYRPETIIPHIIARNMTEQR